MTRCKNQHRLVRHWLLATGKCRRQNDNCLSVCYKQLTLWHYTVTRFQNELTRAVARQKRKFCFRLNCVIPSIVLALNFNNCTVVNNAIWRSSQIWIVWPYKKTSRMYLNITHFFKFSQGNSFILWPMQHSLITQNGGFADELKVALENELSCI